MAKFIVRRVFYMIPTLFVISVISFVIIQLPPGDFLTTYVATLRSQGEDLDAQAIAALQQQYGLGQPVYVQYWKWISGIVLRGDFGLSFEWRLPVADLIWHRLGWTLFVAALTILIGYVLAIPIGVYSATHQYSKLDNLINAWGFLGLGIPNFTMALAVMWFAYAYLGWDLSGLFSDEFRNAPWSWGKVGDLLFH